ncbi:hypothetical protein LX95_00927 [Mesonia algae]|uniref:Lipocalin-like protein n=1 Tax=Mesonia algae TaxID=213248 RepID=A0A2W7I6S3_9FLAO|nr:hypothetical protein [Mesonia algae]PZW42611.1 hypothetical protein LX95_00927 [Mesonia algae]
MKKQICVLLLISIYSCSKNGAELLGTWQVKNNYYKATYKIMEEHDSIKAKVLYYHDGTTIIKPEDQKEYYAFENLKYTKNQYVDAISGATKTKELHPNIALKLIHKDTIHVTKYISKKPLKEVWIRINK